MTSFLDELRTLSHEYSLKQIPGLSELKDELRKAASSGKQRYIYKGILKDDIIYALRTENLKVIPSHDYTVITWLPT